MKRFFCALLASALVLSLTSCGKTEPAASSQPAGSGSGSKVLRVGGESWQVTKIFLEDAAKAFMKDHPDVKVEIQTYADPTVVSNYSINWMKGETPVDLVMIDGASFAEQFIGKDLIYDFDKDLNFFSNFDESKFVPSAIEMSRLHDKQYVIPVISEITAININTKMFKEAGLVDKEGKPLAPKDWEEFYEFAKKLHKVKDGKVVQQGATIQWGKDIHGTVLGVLQASHKTLYQDDGISVGFDNPEFREILSIWQKGVKEGVFSQETFADYDSGRNSYKAGKVAMLVESGSRWIEAGQTLGKDNVSVLPIPGADQNGSVGYVNGVIVPKCSPNAELAVQFIQEQLLGEHVQTSTLNQYGKLPVINEYYAMAEAPDWKNLKNSIDKSVTYPVYKDLAKFIKDLQSILQNSLSKGTSVDTTVQQLQDMVKSLNK